MGVLDHRALFSDVSFHSSPTLASFRSSGTSVSMSESTGRGVNRSRTGYRLHLMLMDQPEPKLANIQRFLRLLRPRCLVKRHRCVCHLERRFRSRRALRARAVSRGIWSALTGAGRSRQARNALALLCGRDYDWRSKMSLDDVTDTRLREIVRRLVEAYRPERV